MKRRHRMEGGCLYVEGLRMRPTAERVLTAICEKDGEPTCWTIGATADELSERTGLNRHVVRARLCHPRRLELIESESIKRETRKSPRCAHRLTTEGWRRANN